MVDIIKTCFKCQRVLPLSDFYKHKSMKDGHLNKCKTCIRASVKSNRNSNLEYYREYDRKRGGRQDKHYLKEYRARYPNKYKAHNTLGNAVRDGVVPKAGCCEICKSTDNIVGHHDDYLKPLEVRWLCQGCHCQWHAKHGEAKNAS